MSLMTDGKAPGPVRFYLACDRGKCTERISFDLVISEPRPDEEADFLGHILHEAHHAAPLIADLGWVFIQGGEGYWCPACAGPTRDTGTPDPRRRPHQDGADPHRDRRRPLSARSGGPEW